MNLQSWRMVLLGLILTSLILHCVELDDIYPWADEGETLVLGEFTRNHGWPHLEGNDHLFCNQFGTTKEGLYIYHGWLQYYLVAFILFFFGKSIFFLRLPFALAGVACVPLLWILAREIKLPRSIQVVSTTLLTFCVPFILLNRNIRYYPLCSLFSLTTILTYIWVIGRFPKRWPWFAISGIILLHTMPPVGGMVLLSTAIHALIFVRNKSVWKCLLYAGAIVTLFYLPYFFYIFPTIARSRSMVYAGHLTFVQRISNILVGFLLHLLYFIKLFFPTLLLIPYFIFLKKKKTLPEFNFSFVVLFLTMIALVCLMMSFVSTKNLFPGYTIELLPFVFLFSGYIIVSASLQNKWFIISFTLIMIYSSFLCLPYWPFDKEKVENRVSYIYADQNTRKKILKMSFYQNQLYFSLRSYFYEITHDYEGPVEGIVQYLKQHAKTGDTYFANNDMHTFYFLTGLKWVPKIPFENPPKWLIKRGGASWDRGVCFGEISEMGSAQTYINNYLKKYPYELIVLDYPDTAQENMPVAPFHHRSATSRMKRRAFLLKAKE